MAAKPKEYKRLPGSGTRREGFVSVGMARTKLYLGIDHLLSIDTLWYTESYKRFYFRDIQAITVRKTHRGRTTSLVFFSIMMFCGIPAIMMDGGASIFWFSIGGFCLFCLLVNSLYGPTCTCHLKTAVQNEELPSLCRLPRARKVLARLQVLIAEAQGGELSHEQVIAQLNPAPAPEEPTAPPVIVDSLNQPPSAAL